MNLLTFWHCSIKLFKRFCIARLNQSLNAEFYHLMNTWKKCQGSNSPKIMICFWKDSVISWNWWISAHVSFSYTKHLTSLLKQAPFWSKKLKLSDTIFTAKLVWHNFCIITSVAEILQLKVLVGQLNGHSMLANLW